MNNSLLFRCLVTALLVCATSAAYAQDSPAGQDTPEPEAASGADTSSAETSAEEDAAEEDAAEEDEDATDAEPEDTVVPAALDDEPVVDEPTLEPSIAESPEETVETPVETEGRAIIAPPEKTSPIADLASSMSGDDFVPLEDLNESVLQSITPAKVYPFVDWSGSFRLQSSAKINFDLDTQGTSAVPPPLEQYTPANDQTNIAVDPEANTHWSTNMRLRLEPEPHITDSLRLHIDAAQLDTVVLGTQQGGADYFGVAGIDSSQPIIKVNEAWAEVDVLSATLRAGRMDDHWGLGIFANDGDCFSCRVETPIDRVSLTIPFWSFYGRLTADFPADGLATSPLTFAGQAYDAGQIDDVDQYTLAIFHQARTRQDRELRAHRLHVQKKPVFEIGRAHV